MACKALVALLCCNAFQSALAACDPNCNEVVASSDPNDVTADCNHLSQCRRCKVGYLWRESSQECEDGHIGEVYTQVDSDSSAVYVLEIEDKLSTSLGDMAIACNTWGWKMYRPQNFRDIKRATSWQPTGPDTNPSKNDQSWILSTYPTRNKRTWNNYIIESSTEPSTTASTQQTAEYVEDAVGLQFDEEAMHVIEWDDSEPPRGRYPTKLSAVFPNKFSTDGLSSFCDPQGDNWKMKSAGAEFPYCRTTDLDISTKGKCSRTTTTDGCATQHETRFWIMCEPQASCNPPVIPHMDGGCDKATYKSGESCRFSCTAGATQHESHRATNQGQATCRDGNWGKPACHAPCPDFEMPNGAMLARAEHGTYRDITCGAGAMARSQRPQASAAKCHDGTWKYTETGEAVSWRACSRCAANCATCSLTSACATCSTDTNTVYGSRQELGCSVASCQDSSWTMPTDTSRRDVVCTNPNKAVNQKLTGDPLVRNLRGETFDVMQSGKHSLVCLPRGVCGAQSDLHVQATVVRQGEDSCAHAFVQDLTLEGKRVGDAVTVSAGTLEKEKAFDFGGVKVLVEHVSNPHVSFLNVNVQGLLQQDLEIGGLLGLDSHQEATAAPSGCPRKVLIRTDASKEMASQITAN